MIEGATYRCMADIDAKLQLVPELKGKIVHVYNKSDLLDKAKGIVLPFAGIFYNGISANSGGGESHKIGNACVLRISVMILTRIDTLSSANMQQLSGKLLDSARNEIFESISPLGHYWNFTGENAEIIKDVVVYVQQWQTPFTLSKIERV